MYNKLDLVRLKGYIPRVILLNRNKERSDDLSEQVNKGRKYRLFLSKPKEVLNIITYHHRYCPFKR